MHGTQRFVKGGIQIPVPQEFCHSMLPRCPSDSAGPHLCANCCLSAPLGTMLGICRDFNSILGVLIQDLTVSRDKLESSGSMTSEYGCFSQQSDKIRLTYPLCPYRHLFELSHMCLACLQFPNGTALRANKVVPATLSLSCDPCYAFSALYPVCQAVTCMLMMLLILVRCFHGFTRIPPDCRSSVCHLKPPCALTRNIITCLQTCCTLAHPKVSWKHGRTCLSVKPMPRPIAQSGAPAPQLGPLQRAGVVEGLSDEKQQET